METRAGDPGAFAQFDLARVDSPAFVVDAAKLRANLRILADIGERSGTKMLSALKAFSMWSTAPIIGEYLDGVCASGLWEARLASEFYDGEIATYCAAYKGEDLPEILSLSDHVIFNSPGQIERFAPLIEVARARGDRFDIGLRINPLHAEGEVPRYDPCAAHSRLGFPIDQLTAEHMALIDGLHMHTLCEQDFAPLARTWDVAFDALEPHFGQFKWINLGGGHHITRDDYQRDDLVQFLLDLQEDTGAQVYLEPGEAVALDAGILVGTILDTLWQRHADRGHRHFRHLPHARRDRGALSPGDARRAGARSGGGGRSAGRRGPPRRSVMPRRRRHRRLPAAVRTRARRSASPSSTRRTTRWSRPPPSTACRCPRSGYGTARAIRSNASADSAGRSSATGSADG